MRKLILSFAVLSLMAGGARADLVLGTDYSPGTPLTMNAGTTSGPMLVNVVSDNPPNDVMSTWNAQLMIAPESGATGNLTFQDPTGTSAPNPPNYVFGSNGLGIALSPTNTPTVLGANDFFDPSAGVGAIVPGTPGANLLQMDFRASPDASGLFGIYAMEGTAVTQWTDGGFSTLYFTNVPDGTGEVLIGEVMIIGQSVPEPSSLGLLGLAVATLAGWRCGRQRKPSTLVWGGSSTEQVC